MYDENRRTGFSENRPVNNYGGAGKSFNVTNSVRAATPNPSYTERHNNDEKPVDTNYNESAAHTDEKMPETTNATEKAADVPDISAETEKGDETPKAKRGRKGKPKTLDEYYEYREKLTKQRDYFRKKASEVNKRISEINAAIHDIEFQKIEDMCRIKNCTLKELNDFLEKLPKGKSLDELTGKADSNQQT